jgi:acyl transferase domain-containing protein/enoyl-CoA hydratase/carnithine racemase
MRDQTIVYCQSYLTAPLIEACRRRGVFDLLDASEYRDGAQLIRSAGANAGYFTVALDVLVELGRLEKSGGAYRLSGEPAREPDLAPLYASDPEQLIGNEDRARWLKETIEQLGPADAALGCVVVPLIVYLQGRRASSAAEALEQFEPPLSRAVAELFRQQRWLTADGAQWTESGDALLRQNDFSVAAAYRPLLHAVPELLFGDAEGALRELRGGSWPQSLRRRVLDEEGAAADLWQEITEIFDREPLEQQPCAVVDIDCDDGAVLKEVFRVIEGRTARGARLGDLPVRLIAVDADPKNLERASETLAGLPHHVVPGEVGHPETLRPTLEQRGVNSEEALHLRRFVDSRLKLDGRQSAHGPLAVLAADQPEHYLDRDGRAVDALTALSCWQQHLRTLAQTVGQSRLLIVEAHAAPPRPDGRDWLHRLLQESPIGAEAFIVLAASVGLFNDDGVQRYPRTAEPCRVSLHNLARRDYIVRHAVETDIERLCELEALCWQHTRTPESQIRARLQRYPQGQFVLEKEGRVLGVVYSQRIASDAALMTRKAADVHELHDPSGSIIQLLAVNIDPRTQNASYGDQLLEFMLQRCSLVAGVTKVVGVTLCKRFDLSLCFSFEEYIRQQGSGRDPVLAFHHAHGAEVVGVVPGYRPEDHTNLHNGVLVAYDILNRPRRRQRLREKTGAPLDARQIGDFVRAEAATLLGLDAGELDLDRPVMEMGLDSADLLKLQQLVEERFELELQSGFFFEYSSIRKVVQYLTAKLGVPAAGEPADAPRIEPAPEPRQAPQRDPGLAADRAASTDVAVIGMACKLPGGIERPDQLWRVLVYGECVVGTFPRQRGAWPSSKDYPAIDQGGFVNDVEAFDATFFRMSPAEAQLTDPQQRMLLEVAWACLEDAGILRSTLRGTNTGVFVGASNADYSRLMQEAGLEIEAHAGVGSSLAILANRLSYFFDLSGPSIVFDTACSSSLVALHSAVHSLRSGECTTALAGGVNLICHPDLSIAYHKAGMLSPDGRCKAFDAKADGYVRSEGAVVLLLKPLRAALADGNRVHAVIRGSATNHGGLASGLTVPNPQKQKELLVAAWKDAGIAAGDLTYLEAHGTGTSLGDPIEVQGMQAAYAEFGNGGSSHPCAIGSVKSNLGHLESAAGITGLLKVILSLQHQQLPPSVNFTQLNPKIRLKDTPFFVQDRLCEWETDGPRIAGISSFGSGGANAHVVLQEYPPVVPAERPDGNYLFVLSAATVDRLRAYANDVIQWLERHATAANFADAIYTWQVGRTAMKERLAIKVKDHGELLRKLKQWMAGNRNVADLWSGLTVPKDPSVTRVWQTKTGRRLIEQALSETDLDLVGTLWASGLSVDWRRFYKAADGRVSITLPTYPFARERYWVDMVSGRQRAVGGAYSDHTSHVIHPLLHSNTSDLNQQSYSSLFTGEEFFLSDHQVRADGRTVQKVLPGVTYLEMARAAIDNALPGQPESISLELRNTVWVQPIVVNRSKQIRTALSPASNHQIDYEVFSVEGEERFVHCQGRAVLSRLPMPARIDLERLKSEMVQRPARPGGFYAAYARMGLLYGPSFQVITGIHQGRDQLLAYLRLPHDVHEIATDYVLHPSMMDGALQACVWLLDGASEGVTQPRLPFALESLRIVSPCTPDMVAWVRLSPGSQPDDKVVKLDIDLCDERGIVYVQMQGFSTRMSGKGIDTPDAPHDAIGSLLATPVWEPNEITVSEATPRMEYAEHHVLMCELARVSVEQLQALLPDSHCKLLNGAVERRISERFTDHAGSSFARIQAIFQSKPRGKVLVQIVASRHRDHVLLLGLAGLLKTAALENPQFVGQLLLIPGEIPVGELARRLDDEKAYGVEPIVRYEANGRFVPRWQEVAADPEGSSISFVNQGVYLITGGLGGLGLLFAREILDRTADACVVLTGRSPLDAEKQALLDALSVQPGRISYRQVDLIDYDQVTRLISGVKYEYGRLDGILHCAGCIADSFILRKTTSQFAEVLAPKVTGTVNLDLASQDVELDFFVLFSSIVGAMGNVGQADYAAANGFMDAFAAYRNRQVAAKERYGRTRAINWPLWQAGGMKMDARSPQLLQRSTGMQPLQTATGIQAFYRSMALPHDQILVIEGDVAQMRRTLLNPRTIVAQPQPQPQAAQAGQSSDESLIEKTEELLRKQLAAVLKLPVQAVDAQAPLEEYGIDSMLAMKLISQLEETFDSLAKTLFFEYQTIRELTDYFVSHHAAQLESLFAPPAAASGVSAAEPLAALTPALPPPAAARRPTRLRGSAASFTSSEPIAIVGLSGRYPGALDVETYWQNLREGKDSIVEVPRDRWEWQAYFSEDRNRSGRHYSKWGGFIDRVDEFDPQFFNIAPKEAKYIDPQERLFLQHAWMAVEDAGYTRAGLQIPAEQDLAGQVGVYVGVMWSEYQLFGAEAKAEELRMGFAGNLASIANRVSYVLNVHGPSVTLDTMCSSSLTAIHFACQDLKLGRTSLALAGGVNVSVHPHKYLMLSIGQFISSDGHCQSFGEGGDGYIPGEGVGVVVLKRLSEAERDGDHIYGVIRGSALTHGGKTSGYTVPNPQAQASAISRALAESHTDARHISYIEAHGTGTKLGDPIEIAALGKAFNQYTQEKGFCLIGSAKSNIGHCESAAGIAGLTKVLLQMQHQTIVPSLHSTQLNPHINFDGSPFVVNQTLRPWEAPVVDGRTLPRIAGISSFGAGGSNAHMIVEEYPAPARQPMSMEQVVIVLSARTIEQLRQKAAGLLELVRARGESLDLVATAYTLQVGREPMDERLGFVVSSAAQLAEKLAAYVAGDESIEDSYSGQVRRNKEALAVFTTDTDLQQAVEKWIANRKLSRLLDMWVKGLELDWGKLYGEAKPARVSLPTYPFARERHWIETPAQAASKTNTATTGVLHPLLHSNTSDLTQQSYSSTFTGDEFFLSEGAFPATAYLEMARAAVEKASHNTSLELRKVMWAEPAAFENQTVNIALLASGGDEIAFEIYSQTAGNETIHCQGRAMTTREPAPAALDLARIAAQMRGETIEPESVYAASDGASLRAIASIDRGEGELLAHLRIPRSAEASAADFVLHPSLLHGALTAAAAFNEGAGALPVTLESLRVMAPCAMEMVAWVRQTPSGLDIDLCDGQGNVAAQLRGLTRQAVESVEEGEVLPVVTMPAHAALEQKEIAFLPAVQAALPALRKSAAIALAAPGAIGSASGSNGRKPAVTLASTGPVVAAHAAAAVSPVKLYDCGNGILSIEIAASRSHALIAHAVQALDRAESDPAVKVLMLSGIEHCFSRGGRDESNEAVERSLFRRLVSFPFPVIAVQPGDVIGAGFLAAALCDFMVCHEDAQYGFTDAAEDFVPTPAETSLFSERFGELRANDFLFGAGPFTGKQLRARGWTCPMLPWPEVQAHAEQLAAALAAKSRDALRLLKQHLTRNLRALVDELAPIAAAGDFAAPTDRVLKIRLDSIAELAHVGDCKAVVLISESDELQADMTEIERLLAGCEVPVVAALTGNATGNAWLAAQLCDAVVYSKQGRYSAAGISAGAAMLFAHRLGSEANEIVLTGADYSGAELQQRIAAVTVVDSEAVLPTASDMAASWARLPRAALAAWKKRSASALKACSLAGAEEPADETPSPRVTAPVPIPLQSRAVRAMAYPDGIVVVKMEEREAKNMFSDALVAGVAEAFAHVEHSTAYKVVILTGYDSYFASGGTKETLLAIQQGTAKFTDVKVFQAALDCRLPVIAAMQGHGIGAGWSMGMFADLALLSEESRYVSPYMGYGFTPGAGATYIFGEKIGHDLARESLLTAQQYTGRELAARGVALRALPRAEVETAAMLLARQIARAPRRRLLALKEQLAARIRNAVEETYRLELAMHEKTFVGRSDTLAQIESEFQSEKQIAPQQLVPPTSSQPAGGDALRAITAALRALLADELQLPERDVDESAQFVDLGLDSISGVSWIRKINEMYQTSIEAIKVYSYPTLVQLSRYVRDEAERHGRLPAEVAPAPAAAPAVATSIVAPRPAAAARPAGKALISLRSGAAPRLATAAVFDHTARAPQAIAVIGMAGRFPRARNLDEFWENIAGGRDCITEVPPMRWDVGAYYQPGDPAAGKSTSRWAGTLEDHDRFDPLFFNISPTEAENMEPQQRLFLEACWHSIENAGYAASTLSGSRCGVFVGCADGDYHQLSRQHQLSAQGFTGSAMSILAARISYFLNLQGPCISIDTACSSSLVALAQACDSLASGASDLALAGGVYVMVGPEMHIKTSQAGMLSPDGRCFAFDQRANGFVPGEGVGVVLLKRLADAERDGDIIHAVIQGWGVNQDGKTNGITAPSPESQMRLEQEVYDKYRIDPAGIQLVEAHGTGTKLGDPIEVEGLKNAFKKYTRDEAYCAIGSVKSNIGHCLTAAGIAGVLKLVLALKHRQLPPSINFERLNEHIDLTGSPFYVNDRLREWTSAGARRAATSSFGFSGTNAHVVIGEHLPAVAAMKRPVAVLTQDAKSIIPLSARTPEQLEQKARELLDLIRRDPSIDLTELAYTLQVGREGMDERLGVLAGSVGQLAETLQAFVDGKTRVADLHRGHVSRVAERMSIISQDEDVREMIVAKWIAGRKFSQLLELWVNGLDLEWHRLYGEVRPRRIELPVYPFARERYWIDPPAAPSAATTAVLHPLLHSNTSDLTEHRYSSTFTGDEFFLADHRVRTGDRNVQKLLPGVAYLEMARAAVSRAIPARREPAAIELHHTVWLTPVVVTEPTEVSIALIAADGDRVDYEVYSVDGDGEQQTVHCRGQAVLSRRAAPARFDLPQLARRMSEGRLDAAEFYAICARMGLHYGPAHQGIAAIELGDGELLAHLRLPDAVEPAQHAFVLHPSLMDSALQASVGLIVDLDDVPAKPFVPFAVESLRIAAPCSRDMAAWVRYANGSNRGDLAVKIDVDLCDLQGNVCVEIRGFASRALEGETRPVLHGSSAPMLHAQGQPACESLSFDDAFYQSLIADVVDRRVSAEEAVDLE